MIAIIWRGIEVYSLSAIFFCVLVLLLPSSQSAVEVMNYLVTSLLPPRILPKLDFQDGIPAGLSHHGCGADACCSMKNRFGGW